MNNFLISDLTFTLIADDVDLENQLNQIFSLCKTSKNKTDVLVEVKNQCQPNIGEKAPQWLVDKLAKLELSQGLVKMFSGPTAETVAVICNGNSISCAWLPSSNNKIQVIICEKDKLYSNESHSFFPLKANGYDYLMHPKKSNEPITSSIHSVIPPMLREVFLNKQKKLLVHSAALKGPDGTGMLLVADAGCGKTTTALSLLRKGALLLGDDLTLLEIDGDYIAATGFPEMLNLTEKTITFFKELHHVQSRVSNGQGSHKKVISPYDVYGKGCMVETTKIDVIYFIEINGDVPSVNKLAFGDAFGKLMHSQTFANNQKIGEFEFNKLSDILGQINAYKLITGNDPEYLGEWLIKHSACHANERRF